jgi:hypothetical protein
MHPSGAVTIERSRWGGRRSDSPVSAKTMRTPRLRRVLTSHGKRLTWVDIRSLVDRSRTRWLRLRERQRADSSKRHAMIPANHLVARHLTAVGE